MKHHNPRPAALLAVTLAVAAAFASTGCAADRWIVNDMEVELFDRLKPVKGTGGDAGKTVYSGEERISMISSSHPEFTRRGGARNYRGYKPIDPLTMGECFKYLHEYKYFDEAVLIADGVDPLAEARKRRAQTAVVVRKSGETWLLVNTGAKEGRSRNDIEKDELQRFVNIKVMVTNMSRIGVEFAPAVALGDGAEKLEADFNRETTPDKKPKPDGRPQP
jgi:hypothetical protein